MKNRTENLAQCSDSKILQTVFCVEYKNTTHPLCVNIFHRGSCQTGIKVSSLV